MIASLAFIASGCVAPHMIVPEALVGRSAALDVVGKSPFSNSWHLGEYEVREASEGADKALEFGFVIVAPGHVPLVVRCTRGPYEVIAQGNLPDGLLPQPEAARGTRERLVCPIGEGALTAAWNPGLLGSLNAGARSLRVEAARGIEGDDLPTPSGYLFIDEATPVAAFERVGVGRLLIAGGIEATQRLTIVAAAVALSRWEDTRGDGDSPDREAEIPERKVRFR